ncbi:hypothetical protein V8F06_006420 [Rhypophila decipiens]
MIVFFFFSFVFPFSLFLSLQDFFSLAHTRPSLSFQNSFLSILIPGSLLLFIFFSKSFNIISSLFSFPFLLAFVGYGLGLELGYFILLFFSKRLFLSQTFAVLSYIIRDRFFHLFPFYGVVRWIDMFGVFGVREGIYLSF